MKISTTITNCKKTAFAFLAVLFSLMMKPESGIGQVAAYGFTQSSGSYTNPLTASCIALNTVATTQSFDDNVYTTTLPFAFTYNGVTYAAGATIYVNSNGFVSFGATSTSTSYNAISSTDGYAGAIAAVSRDLVYESGSFTGTTTINTNTITAINAVPPIGSIIVNASRLPNNDVVIGVSGTTLTMSQNSISTKAAAALVATSGIVTQTTGAAPNQQFYIQWAFTDNYSGGGTGSNLNFQIVLNQTTNTINVIYGTVTVPTGYTLAPAVGLRGISNGDFNNRTGSVWASSTAGAANTSTMTMTNTAVPTSGQTYTWSAPKITTGTITPLTYCAGSNTAAVSVPFTSVGTFASTNTYTAQLSSATGVFPGTSIGTLVNSAVNSGTIPATIPAGTATGTGYRIRVISSNPAFTGTDNGTNITINNPAAPTGTTPQSFCQINNPTIANLTATGGTIQWYLAATGGTVLASATALVNGTTYYASQTVTGCEGSARLAVAVTISSPAAPTGSASQSFCQINNPTVANLTATGSTIQWYAAATGGTALATATGLVNSTTYYASQTVSGCESATRFAVSVTVGNPAAPTGAASQSFCQINNPTVANLTAAGTTIQWYAVATGGSPLAPATGLVNTTTYYASQTVSGCESATRFAVTVTVGNPAAPTGSASQSFCTIDNPTVANLVATGTAIQWYATATGGTPLASTIALVNGTTYYASQTVSGCESATRFAVSVTISNPAAPTGAATQSFCSDANPTVANLIATGTTIQWYAAATGGTALSSATALVNGTHYYASQTVGSCESATRLDVTAVVNTAVTITSNPSPATQTQCATSNVTYTVSATGSGLTYQWYLGSNPVTNGGRISGATTSTLTITGITAADGGDYTVVVSGTSPCSPATSAIAHLDVNQSVTFTAQPITPQTLCPGNTYTIYAQATGTIATYQWYFNGSSYAPATFDGVDKYTLTIPNITAANAGSYRLLLDDGSGMGCSASNSNIAVLNINTSTSTTDPLATQTVCQNAAPTNLSVTASGTGPFTYQWYSNTANNNTTGSTISGQTGSTFTPPTTAAGTLYYYAIVTGNCNSATSATAQVVVNPLPVVTTANTAATCSGTGPNISLTASVVSTFTWTIGTITGGITGASAGSGATINQVLTDPSNSASGSVQYIVTPTATTGSCPGSPYTITVTVNPSPVVTNTSTKTICNNTGTAISLTSSTPGNFTWTIGTITGGITGASAGSGSTINQVLTNPSNSASGSVQYIVTPTAITGTCPGAPYTITVTVNPTPVVTTANTATTCSGTSPNISLTASAPSTFAWTIGTVTGGITGASAGSGATINQALTDPSNSASGSVQYIVTPTSTTGTCSGAPYTITVTVNPLPVVTTANTAATCSGTGPNISLTASVVSTFTWTIGTITGGITGASAGSGATINQVLTDPSNSASGSVQYIVTPTATTGSCPGSPYTITVTVNPSPVVTNTSTKTICNNTGTAISLTSSTPGNFTWTIGTITGGITGASAGSGSTINQVLTNPSNSASGSVQYIVTPTAITGTCPGAPYTITVTVNPTPVVTTANTATTCSGTSPNINLTASAPSTFTWTIGAITGSITGATAGSGTTINQALTDPSNSASGSVQYIVTPTSTTGTCSGAPYTITVTVNTAPAVTNTSTKTICNNTGTALTLTSSTPSTFTWTIGTIAGGITGASAGSGATINQVLSDPSNSASGSVQYIVTPTATTGSCPGSAYTITVTVNPTPTVTNGNTTICNGSNTNITLTSSTPGTFTWTIGTITGGVTGASAGSGATINQVLTNPGTTSAGAIQYIVTPTATTGNCPGSPSIITVSVNPTPTATVTGTTTVCQNSTSPTVTVTNPQAIAITVTYNINGGGNLTVNIPANGSASAPVPTNTPGTTTYNLISVAYQLAPACSNPVTGSAVVTVRPTPTATISGTATVCQNATAPVITFTNAQSLAETVTYNINGGTNTTINVAANSTATISAPTTIAGVYNYNLVSVVYQTAPTCSNTISGKATITVLATPTGNIAVTENSGTTANDNIICAGDAVTFTAPNGGSGASYTWKVNGTTVQGPNTDQTYSTTTLTTGQTVTVDVANSNNCGATFTAPAITVNPLPSATLTVTESSGTSNDNIICPNAPVTLTAAMGSTTYSFLINGTAVATGSSNTFTTTNITSTSTVAVTVTNSNGCQATSSNQTITVSPVPTGTLTVSPGSSFCTGTSVTFTATAGTGNTYNFKVNGATKQNTTASTYITNTLANGDVVSVDVTNSNGCTTTFNPISVTVNPLPTGTLTATENSGVQNDNIICAGSPVTFTATSGYSNYTFYLRGTGAPLYSGSSNVYTTSTLVNNDYITVVVTSGGGCTATFISATITVIASPAGTLTETDNSGTAPNDNIICAGDNATFTATSGYTNYNFKVNGTTVQNGAGNTFSSTALANGDVITVDVTNSNSCVATFNSITITVNPLPTGTLAIAENSGTPNDGIICTGASVTFTAPNGFTNYNFLLNGASVQNGASKTYTTTTLANNDKVTVAVTNSGGCIGILNQYTITVNPLPTVAPITTTAPSFDVCIGSTITLQDATNTGGTFTWNSENTGIATVNASTGAVTGVAAGTAVIDYAYTNSNGCSSTVTATVTVHALPAVQPITGNFNICTGTYSQLSDVTPGGTWSSSNTSVATVDNTGSVHGISQGTATISYSVTDTYGCTTTVTANVTVSDFPSVAPITTTSPSSFNVCIGGTLALADATTGGTWSVINGTGTATITSAGVLTGITAGTVIVSYGISSSCGLPAFAQQTVNVNAPPSATISYAGGPFCTSSGTVSVTQTGTTGGTYSSTSGLTINTSNGTITPATSTAGTYTVTYTIPASATGGCGVYTATTSVTITQAPSATIAYSASPYCTNGGTATVTRTGTTGGTYTKTTGAGTLSLNSSTGDITLGTSTSGTYTITYTIVASGGCAAFSTTASVTITAAPSATISYTGNPFCKTSGTVNPTLTGTAGGTYSSTAGLTISSAGTITPSTSTAGIYTVTYTVAASGGCSVYTATTSVTITAAPTAVAGTAVATCSNNPPVNITAGSSATNYSTIIWTSSGTGSFANANSLTTATYTPSAADISAGSVTLTLTANGNGGCAAAVSSKTLTISAPPAAFVITPSSPINVCQGSTQPLTAGATYSATGSVTVSSGNINLTIPDAQYSGFTVIPGSVTTGLNVSTVPFGAVISSVSVNFNISHPYDGDLVLNLKAPNGNVLNLVDQKGNGGNNFTNTTVSSTSNNPFLNPARNAPYTGIFEPDGDNGVGTPNSGNTVFSNLFSTPGGTWTFGAEDDGPGDQGTILNWSITINYTVANAPLQVTWSPVTDLYTDAGATTAYTGTALSTVYAKPSLPGTKVYTATATNAAGCNTSQNVTLNVGSIPVVTVAADYCAVAGKVQLTATSTPVATSYLWNTGETTQSILVDVSGIYSVTVYSSGSTCPGKGTINVANELITNGNFEAGNVGFTSSYPYVTGAGSLNMPPAYAVDTAANYYGPTFLYGKDHTTGHGKFMMVNGAAGANYQIWQETVSVLPNTTYYFSAWGLELDNLPNNPNPPHQAPANANLQFNVNGAQVGTFGNLPRPNNPQKDADNTGWVRFYGSWTSGSATTSAVVSITDLQGAVYGNNFGLDDISFGTLSTFVDLQSAPGTDAQTVCVNNAIQNIVYSAGSSSTAPTVSPLPAGVTSSWNGVYLTISGTPTVAGNYTYTVTTTGSCQPASASGTITVQAQKITLSSGAASPSVCINSPMANIVFTLSGTATGAATTGLPAGVTGVVTGSGPTYTYTISGTPTAAAGAYPYTVTTSGTCTPVTFNGTITVTSQTITLNSANNTQTVCINSPIANIQYTVGGTGSGATVTGLPPGVTGSYNSGLFIISGSPTSAAGSPYTYMVTTSGTCATATATGTITVTPGASFTLTSGAATNPQTVCKGAAITNITYTVSNAAGASATGLPAGVTGAYSGGVFTISGTPTVAPGTYSYTITSSGGCGVGTTTGSIIVQAQTISLASGTASQSVCANTAMANIIYTIGGTATGASVTGLPAGVTGTLSGNQFIIGGTPTAAAGPYSYTVTTSGTCSVVTATGTITIQAPAVGGTLTSVSICSGSSGTLTLTGQSGTITRWEVSTDFGTTWTQIANTAISQNFSNVMTTTMYRVLVSGCGTVYSSIATVGVHNLWTGRTSTDWNVTSNWSDNLLPSASCTTVMIPSGTPNQPLLTSSVTVPNLMIAAGTSVNLNGQTLEIDGTFTGSTTGFIKSNASSGLIIGGSASTLYFDPSNNYIKTLTLNSSSTATLGDSLNIAAGTFASPGTVTVNSGSTLTTGSMLTIKSNAGGDGRVGQSSGTIAGNVTVERYIPPKRAWRFLAVPFSSSSQTINKAWQEGASPNPDIYTHNNPKPGFGTEITYDNLTAHGFDVNTTLNSSLYYWDSVSTGGTWTSIPSTYLNINSHQAYYLFVRGSRAIDLSLATSAVPDQTVLRSIGSLNEVNGSAVIRNSGTMPAGSFFFTGNPYASPVNLNNVIDGSRTTGFNTNQFWVWDPKLTGTKGVGAYVTYSNGVFTPDNGETGGSYAPTGSPVIQSGQAFFVQMDNSHVSTSLEFHQSDKNTAPEANVFGAQQSPPVTQSKFYTNLMLPSGDSLILVDGVAAAFAKDNNAGVDSKDANKMWNISENIALIRDNNWLAIEFRPVPVLTDTLFYTMYLKQQPYALKISTQDVPSGFPQAWLVDKYLNTRTALNTSEPLIYNFVPNSDTNSYRNRFMLVFKRTLKAIPVATTMSSGGATAATLEGKVDVFPNPVVTGGKATLKFTSMKAGKYEVTVSSLDGKALTAKTIQHEGGNYNYDLQLDARWATGTYLVTIKGENGYTTTVNLIIGK